MSYIPVPKGAGANLAGLFTIDLPQTVTTGQEFAVLVRRISTRTAQNVILESPSLPALDEAAAEGPDVTVWRYVVSTFAVSIPVTTAETMLFPEENTLAIMRWRFQQMAPANR